MKSVKKRFQPRLLSFLKLIMLEKHITRKRQTIFLHFSQRASSSLDKTEEKKMKYSNYVSVPSNDIKKAEINERKRQIK